MREISLRVEELKASRVKKAEGLIQKILELDNDLCLTVVWSFYEVRLTGNVLDEIAGILRRRGKAREFRLTVVIETDQWEPVIKLRKKLNKYGFEIALAITASMNRDAIKRVAGKMLLENLIIPYQQYKDIRRAYEEYKLMGISFQVKEDTISYGEYMHWFHDWVQEKDVGRVNIFTNMIGFIFTGNHISGCAHDSCLGKCFCLDKTDMLHFCIEKKKGSQMYSLKSGMVEELLDQHYYDLLESAIGKRRHCIEECGGFSACKGGCPLAEAQDDCGEYLKKLSAVSAFVEKHREQYFEEIPNQTIRQMFLSMVAFGIELE